MSDRPNVRNPQDLDRLIEIYRDGLLNDVMPFWLRHGVDQEFGGVMTCLDRDGTIIDTDKAMWAQCRFTWMLGELFNHSLLQNDKDRQKWLSIAKANIRFIDEFGFDPGDDRMWFHVTRDGRPIRKRRYSFTESFAAIAFGEMALATGNDEFAETAESCFDQFVQWHVQPPADTAKFTSTRSLRSIGFPMITINTARELQESIGLESAKEWIELSILDIDTNFCRDDTQCVLENVGADGQFVDHFDGRLLNPGHAVECAWFIMQEGKISNDSRLVELGCRMLDWMWARGWDTEYGGLFYFVDVNRLPVQEYWHDMKFWWPHNEAIIATLLAYQLTGDGKYADWHAQVHAWTYEHFPDGEHGEWFGYLHRDGTVSTQLKGNLWKGPFHIPRMQLKCWEICEELRVHDLES